MALTDRLRDLDQRLLPGTRETDEDAEAYLRRVASSRAITPAQAGDVMVALRELLGVEPGGGDEEESQEPDEARDEDEGTEEESDEARDEEEPDEEEPAEEEDGHENRHQDTGDRHEDSEDGDEALEKAKSRGEDTPDAGESGAPDREELGQSEEGGELAVSGESKAEAGDSAKKGEQ
jgi:hypothetical protein